MNVLHYEKNKTAALFKHRCNINPGAYLWDCFSWGRRRVRFGLLLCEKHYNTIGWCLAYFILLHLTLILRLYFLLQISKFKKNYSTCFEVFKFMTTNLMSLCHVVLQTGNRVRRKPNIWSGMTGLAVSYRKTFKSKCRLQLIPLPLYSLENITNTPNSVRPL